MQDRPVSVDDAIETIRRFAREGNWTREELARAIETGGTSLRDLHAGDKWNPKARTLRKLFKLIPPGWTPAPTRKDDDG